jgi:hypothetical protein
MKVSTVILLKVVLIARVEDYAAAFHKQERVDGELLPEEAMLLKFQKPLKVYMKWLEDPHRGREALYVEGRDDNKVIAHEGGIWGFVTLSLDPRGSLAMKDSRQPITDIGFGGRKKMRPPLLQRHRLIVGWAQLYRAHQNRYGFRLACSMHRWVLLRRCNAFNSLSWKFALPPHTLTLCDLKLPPLFAPQAGSAETQFRDLSPH